MWRSSTPLLSAAPLAGVPERQNFQCSVYSLPPKSKSCHKFPVASWWCLWDYAGRFGGGNLPLGHIICIWVPNTIARSGNHSLPTQKIASKTLPLAKYGGLNWLHKIQENERAVTETLGLSSFLRSCMFMDLSTLLLHFIKITFRFMENVSSFFKKWVAWKKEQQLRFLWLIWLDFQ